MKQMTLIAAALIILLSGCSRETLDQAHTSYIDSLMNSVYKANAPGAVVLVARDGVPLFRKAYGLASVELNVPNKPENVFAIGSMTKQFVAVCILQLVGEGKLSLQDDLRRYLPEVNTHGRLITVEHLLTHTNGILDHYATSGFAARQVVEPSDQELLTLFNNDSLMFEPGSDWSYNDYGYTLLVYMVERVSGMRMDEYLQKRIFQPAGMKTAAVVTNERTFPLFVPGYASAGDSLYRRGRQTSWKWDRGSGDILMSADDLLKWDEALYTDTLIKRGLLEKAWTPFILANGETTFAGYGWVVSQWKGLRVISHGGTAEGFASVALRIPSQHLFVAVLSNNQTTYGALYDLGYEIALIMAGSQVSVPPSRGLTAEQLAEYGGAYETHIYDVILTANYTRDKVYRYITVRDSLLISQRWAWESALVNVGDDLFLVRGHAIGNQTYMRFLRDADRKIASLEVFTEPWQLGPVRVEKKTDHVMPKKRVPVVIDERIVRSYVGRYNFGGEHSSRVFFDGKHIYLGRREIFPESETRFFYKNWGGTIEFLKNSKNVVTGMTITTLGKSEGRKVE